MSTPDATPLPLSVELAEQIIESLHPFSVAPEESPPEELRLGFTRLDAADFVPLIDARVRPLWEALLAVSEFDDEDWLPDALGAQVKAALTGTE